MVENPVYTVEATTLAIPVNQYPIPRITPMTIETVTLKNTLRRILSRSDSCSPGNKILEVEYPGKEPSTPKPIRIRSTSRAAV